MSLQHASAEQFRWVYGEIPDRLSAWEYRDPDGPRLTLRTRPATPREARVYMMGDKSPRKQNSKKPKLSTKEKQDKKRVKKQEKGQTVKVEPPIKRG